MNTSQSPSTPSRGPIQAAAIQLTCSANVEENIKTTIDQIVNAAKAGANLICLQELFSSQYFCQSEDHDQFALAESIPGSTTDRLCEVAKANDVVIVAGLFERRTAGLFHNSAVVIESDGTIVGTKSFISLQAIWVSRASTHRLARSAFAFVGTNGSLNRLD